MKADDRRPIGIRLALVAVVALTGCGDAPDGAAEAPPDGAAEAPADAAVDQESARTRGEVSATLTVGNHVYRFERVLCASGEETGRAGTEFTLSAIQDGLQLDATIDSRFGHVVSLDDIENPMDPAVSWTAGGPVAGRTGDPGEIIRRDGDRVTVSATFLDERSGETTRGSLEATCP